MMLPKRVIDKDHELEGRHDRASEALAKHRWHWTLDESNPDRVSQSAYARAVGRSQGVISHYGRGWVIYQERLANSPAISSGFTIHDAIRLSGMKAEDQEFAEAIAEGSGRPVAQVARGDNRHRFHETVGQAKARAERRGTDAVDEARRIAENQRRSQEMDRRERERRAQRHTARYVEIEGDLAAAQRRLTHALSVGKDVGFDDEEMELIRDSIAKIRALLDLIDLRMAGSPGIDWDAELAKLGGDA
jgi:hypothetical protein